MLTAFVRDVTERQRIEEAALVLRDAEARRKQALEITDSVVQSMAAASYAIELGSPEAASHAVTTALDSAHEIVSDLLTEQNEASPIGPGDLVRAASACLDVDLSTVLEPRAPRAPSTGDPLRIVLADDTDDIRMLLRYGLGRYPDLEIAGEATNGQEAIDAVVALAPDVVLLDLAMPVMDGLQALPEILRLAPDTTVIALSGYANAPHGGEGDRARRRRLHRKGQLRRDAGRPDPRPLPERPGPPRGGRPHGSAR